MEIKKYMWIKKVGPQSQRFTDAMRALSKKWSYLWQDYKSLSFPPRGEVLWKQVINTRYYHRLQKALSELRAFYAQNHLIQQKKPKNRIPIASTMRIPIPRCAPHNTLGLLAINRRPSSVDNKAFYQQNTHIGERYKKRNARYRFYCFTVQRTG